MMTRNELIDALKSIHIDGDQNQTKIAQAIGLSRITINRFMRRPDRPFHLKTLVKIERFVIKYKKEIS